MAHRLRPLRFASYSATSDFSIQSSTLAACSGINATPMLTPTSMFLEFTLNGLSKPCSILDAMAGTFSGLVKPFTITQIAQ